MSNMKTYTIDVCAFGSVWEQDVDCPLEWRGSGCYDVQHECYQEAKFTVWANSLGNALKMIRDEYEQRDREWCINPTKFKYDPATVKETDCEDDGEEEIFDSEFDVPKEGTECPERYTAIID